MSLPTKSVPRVAVKAQQGQFLVFWVGGNLFIRMAALFHETIHRDFRAELGEELWEVVGKVLGGGYYKTHVGKILLYDQSKTFGLEDRKVTLKMLEENGIRAVAEEA